MVRKGYPAQRDLVQFKKKVVAEYLEGGISTLDLAMKHGIHAESTVAKWIKLYNSHEELTDSRPEGGMLLMANDIKPRKTTREERIKIVEHCIAHSNNYALTAKEFSCSYGQVYSWVRKYNEKGIDGLKDGRGRNKNETEMSEVERLRAENRLLRAEKKRQQMEIDLLKNSKTSRGGDPAKYKTFGFIFIYQGSK
jgi:transposase-like protein